MYLTTTKEKLIVLAMFPLDPVPLWRFPMDHFINAHAKNPSQKTNKLKNKFSL